MATGFGNETEYDGKGINGAVTIADVNGDGLPDLVVANRNDPQSSYNGPDGGNVTVLLNTGGGAFAPGVTYSLPDYGNKSYGGGPSGAPADVTTADLTGDGRQDIVVADGHGNVIVLPNEGQGGFGTPVVTHVNNYTQYAYATRVVAVDVNGDGKPDLLIGGGVPLETGGFYDDGGVQLLTNNGSGGFAAPVTYDKAPPAQNANYAEITTGFATADVNGDGRPDLIVVHGGTGSGHTYFEVSLNDGAGGFAAPTRYDSGGGGLLAVGDVNGDGQPDIILAGGDSTGGSIEVFLNDGSGGYNVINQPTYALAPNLDPTAITLADVNGDGAPDLVVAATAAGGVAETEVLLNDGHGGFGAATVYDGLAATASADLNGDGKLDLAGPGAFNTNASGIQNQSVVVGLQGVNQPAVCYAAGTRILTRDGEVAVEALRVGDLVMTLLGQGFAPVRWLGHHTLDLRSHPAPGRVRPIRIRAGAFGNGRPHRDLRVSPGHAIYVDGALIQAERLVNGATISSESCDTVTYWHVELDRHDVLIAEGLPAESYLDTGNRTAFVGGGAYLELHPDFAPRHWAETCAPLTEAGPVLAAVKARLLETARTAFGRELTEEHGLHVLADGVRHDAREVSGSVRRFLLPPGCRDVRLASSVWVPEQMLCASSDTRTLGVCLRRLSIDGRALDIDDDALAEGWAEPERHDGGEQRWTTGFAKLPAGGREIEVELIGEFVAWSAAAEAADGAADGVEQMSPASLRRA